MDKKIKFDNEMKLLAQGVYRGNEKNKKQIKQILF